MGHPFRLTGSGGFYYRIVASRVKGVAFQEPPDRQKQTLSRTEPLDSFQGVRRASGRKAAGGKG